MKFNIPDMQTAFELIRGTKSFVVKGEVVDGEEFAIFTYRFVDYEEFLKDVRRLEFRGIAYHTGTGRCFPSVHKFFNYNEVPETDIVFDANRKYAVFEKIDGSLIVPVLLNGKIFVKSKNSFFSAHAKTAYRLVEENENCKEFIKQCYKDGICPLFELVSPFHRVIIEYPRTELILIQAREIETGNYIDLFQMKQLCDRFEIRIPSRKECEIGELIKDCMSKENIEGYVAISDNSTPFGFKKFKTKWYLQRHRINTDLKDYEIVELVIEEKIDDVLPLVVSDELRQRIMEVVNQVNKFRHYALERAREISASGMTRKEVALKYKNDFLFPVLIKSMSCESEREMLNVIDNFILKHCKKEKQTGVFLEGISRLMEIQDRESKSGGDLPKIRQFGMR